MDTMFMNSKNSESKELNRIDEHVYLSNLIIYCTWKNKSVM